MNKRIIMNKTILITVIAILFSINSNAQKRKGKEKIRAYKIAFLTEKLNLSTTEAEKFWPIYNAYDKKMVELHHKKRKDTKRKIKQLGGIDNLDEKSAKELIEKAHFLEEERIKVKRVFFEKVKSVLSYKKILQLKIAEHEFNRKLMRKLRGKKNK